MSQFVTSTSPAARSGVSWLERVFGISTAEVNFDRRGFPGDMSGIRERLERAGSAFVDGYNRALRHRRDLDALDASLGELDRDLHGFAYEGASMALALIDMLAPWSRSRWRAFLERHPEHIYLIMVGAGWAMARLFRRELPRFARDADPTLWPLIYDGLGFHQGFFRPSKYVRARHVPALIGYAARGFDQGLGRCCWFVEGASPARIAATFETFDPARRGDLWSGVGLACAYAGGLDGVGIGALASRAGAHRVDLAQGVAFAARARLTAGNITPATELACRVLWSADAATVGGLVDDDLLHALACEDGEPRYEAWRREVRNRFPPLTPDPSPRRGEGKG